MTGKMRFCQQANTCDAARVWKLVPLRLPYRPKVEIGNNPRKQLAKELDTAKRRGRASTRVNHPFDSIHKCRSHYCWACPHSEQNLLTLGIGLPQLRQNFVSGPAAVPPAEPGAAGTDSPAAGAALFRASIIACPMAAPAPSPAPTPAAPPPSFAAAIGIDC